MIDSRFETVAQDPDELVALLDVDELEDVESLIMALFNRQIGVRLAHPDLSEDAALEVLLPWDGSLLGIQYPFPMSVMDLARSTAEDLETYKDEDAPTTDDSPDILALDDGELIVALRRALGMVRVLGLIDG